MVLQDTANVLTNIKVCKILSNKRFVVFSCPISRLMSVVKDEFDNNSQNNRSFLKNFFGLIFQWDLQVCQICLKYERYGVMFRKNLLIWHGMTLKHQQFVSYACTVSTLLL